MNSNIFFLKKRSGIAFNPMLWFDSQPNQKNEIRNGREDRESNNVSRKHPWLDDLIVDVVPIIIRIISQFDL